MIIEKVYSPIFDKDIKKDINNSPIWKDCYHQDDIPNEYRDINKTLYCYTIKFDGVTPIQVNNIEKV